MRNTFQTLALALILSGPLSAQVIQFNFSGNIDFIMERFAGSTAVYVNQPSSSTYGFPFALGQQVQGAFTYELTSVPWFSGDRAGYDNIGSLSFTVATTGYSFSDPSGGDVALYNDSNVSDGPDLLIYSASLVDGSSLLHKASVNLRDSTGTAFTTHTALPSWLSLDAHTYHKLFFSIEQQGYGAPFVSMTVQLNSLTLAAVPEPSSAALLAGAGVLCFAVAVRRRMKRRIEPVAKTDTVSDLEG